MEIERRCRRAAGHAAARLRAHRLAAAQAGQFLRRHARSGLGRRVRPLDLQEEQGRRRHARRPRDRAQELHPHRARRGAGPRRAGPAVQRAAGDRRRRGGARQGGGQRRHRGEAVPRRQHHLLRSADAAARRQGGGAERRHHGERRHRLPAEGPRPAAAEARPDGGARHQAAPARHAAHRKPQPSFLVA